MTPLRCESDNHADTHCFGPNFRPIEWMDIQCTVNGFMDGLGSAERIEICTGATAWDSEHGETLILIFGQGLWFGNQMNKSLVNPNQCRAYGISVCDDPFDPYSELGFYDNASETNIPMEMHGSFCTMLTRCPTQEELEECRWIIMSNESHWDPTDPFTHLHSNRKRSAAASTSEYDSALFAVAPELVPEEFVRRISATRAHEQGPKRQRTEPKEPLYIPPTPFPNTAMDNEAMFTSERHHKVSVDNLARKWMIGRKRAKATIQATTQEAIRSALHPLTRRYRTDLMQMKHRRLNCTFYTDFLFAKRKSISQNTGAQLWTDGEGYVFVDPQRSKKLSHISLDNLANTVGIPNMIFSDGANEETGPNSQFVKKMQQMRIKGHQSEPYSQWQNKAENTIGKLKQRWKRRMIRRRAPAQVWDYALVYESEIMTRMSSGRGNRSALERITGDTIDISEWTDFEFYDLIWFWDTPYTEENPCIGRWLGVAHRVGSALCYWVLKPNGQVIARSTVQHVTKADVLQDSTQATIKAYHIELFGVLGDGVQVLDGDTFAQFILDDVPDDDLESATVDAFDDVMDIDDVLGECDHVGYNGYINAEISVPSQDGNKVTGRVVKRVKGNDGMAIGTSNSNPLLDTSEYIVEFNDGTSERYSANIIAENMLSQVDDEGARHEIFQEITDHRMNKRAIPKEKGFTVSHNGRKVPKVTTVGWELLVEWKSGESQWVPLKNVKDANPIELAEYAIANHIDDEPAFVWWVQDTLRQRNRIINKVKSKYWQTTHKFGIRLPKTVDEALRIDKETGTTFWRDAINKEMLNVRPAFRKWEGGTYDDHQKLVGYQEITCHMIFDIKLDGDFTRKARFVAGGHTTDPPASTTYSSVVSRDSVRIAFVIAAMHDLDLWAADIGNAYLNAPCREKIWTLAGSEFGTEKGQVMIIDKALYGLKTSGASWRAMLSETMKDLQFVPTKADPDVYIRPATKPCGYEYYEMALIYVDDILYASHDTKPFELAINNAYRLKPGSAGEPTRYLGANIKKFVVDGVVRYGQTCEDYVNAAVENIEKMLIGDGREKGLSYYGKKNANRPFPASYRPECDTSPELNNEMASRYLQLIGILRWAVELGRIDIYTEVSVLSQHQCLPREGHLDALYRCFWYLKKAKPSRVIFDPTMIEIDERIFHDSKYEEWKDFYDYAEEPIPPMMPEPRGLPMRTVCFVDADHAANKVTRRSHSGIIIYLQNTPVIWFSKRQNTVETSSFGSEFVALRIATELIQSLRYKLRMFGVAIDGPTDVLCDNQSVTKNASVPTSTLTKKHNSICYHRVREAQASGAQRVGWINGEYNQADLLTKTTLSTEVKSGICHEIYGWRHKDIYEWKVEDAIIAGN